MERAFRPAHAPRGTAFELSALLAFGACELGEEVFVDTAENILGAIGGAAQSDIADEIDELAKPLLVQTWRCVILRQDTFSDGLSCSIAAMALSTICPISGCGALAFRWAHRASLGTQKMLAARYSSGSSGSAP